MGKLEDISTMLIEELSAFDTAVKELSKNTKEIQNVRISVDTKTMHSAFKQFNNQIQKNYEEQELQLNQLRNKLNKTIIFPKWMIILFSLFLLFSVSSLGFGTFQYFKTKEQKQQAYEKGVGDMKNYFQQFLEDNPKTRKVYDKWRKNK